tara:strand:- start:1199 stop:2248 length:1050 start_codon:yes stop_codon:yes gene_type:complete
MAGNDWMAALANTKRLHEITMPGAHDAGMVKKLMNKSAGMATLANAACQELPIGTSDWETKGGTSCPSPFRTQLHAGVRWLDVRLESRPTVCGGPSGYRCFHSTTYGETSGSIASGVIDFLNQNPQETVFVCLTKSSTNSYAAFYTDLVNAHTATAVQGAPPFTPYAPTGHNNQVAALKMGSVRGRVILVMDKPPAGLTRNYRIIRAKLGKYGGKETFDPTTYLAFNRTEAGDKYDFVLNVAGSYSNKNNTKDIIKGQRKRMENVKAGWNDARPWLGMFYTTNTAPIGLRTTSIETQDKHMWKEGNRSEWSRLAFQNRRLTNAPVANIVMMDFTDGRRCQFVVDEGNRG